MKAKTNLSESLSPELKKAVLSIAEALAPVLEEIHNSPATSKNYYADYMRILSYKPDSIKLLALALLYAGANPAGLEAALKLV